MSNEAYDSIIVGAGLCGLNLGFEINQKNPTHKLLILEKSKSCGGRMATRRVDDLKFDHGAQFIKSELNSLKLIEFWNNENVISPFPSNNINAYCSSSGMTLLAKAIAKKVQVTYNFKVQKLEFSTSGWKIFSEDESFLNAKQVILTCPLPQSTDILKNSALAYDENLNSITYAKALVLLIESESSSNLPINYQDNINKEIFSLSSQLAKGLSSKPSWTMVMSEAWSEKYFNETDETIIAAAKASLKKLYEFMPIQKIQLKKWRYSHPQKIAQSLFANPHPNLYLAGDAFGGPSLGGTLKSSYAVFKKLNEDANDPKFAKY